MPIVLERRYAARILRAARALALTAPLVIASCGGNTPGTLLDVPNRVAIADMTNNGLNDIVVVSAQIDQSGLTTNNPGFAAVILQNPSSKGSFEPTQHYETDQSPSGLALYDLTGSGTKDIIVADFSAGMISVLMHDPNHAGQYLTAVNYPTGGSPNDVQVADMNGDGKPDLVIADGGSTGHVIVLLQDAANPGTFLAPMTSAALPNRAIRVAAADLNGDGLPDVVVTTFDTSGDGGTVSILFNNPASPASFMPEVDISTPGASTSLSEPTGIAIADLNGDGLPDIAVAAEGASTDGLGNVGAAVFLQDAANPGTFLAPVTYVTEAGGLSIAIGDLNGDGFPDLVIACQYPSGSGEVAMLLNTPTAPGTFQTVTYLTGLSLPVSVAIGDLNGDGIPDLATADGTGAVVYFQNPVGTWSQAAQVGG